MLEKFWEKIVSSENYLVTLWIFGIGLLITGLIYSIFPDVAQKTVLFKQDLSLMFVYFLYILYIGTGAFAIYAAKSKEIFKMQIAFSMIGFITFVLIVSYLFQLPRTFSLLIFHFYVFIVCCIRLNEFNTYIKFKDNEVKNENK